MCLGCGACATTRALDGTPASGDQRAADPVALAGSDVCYVVWPRRVAAAGIPAGTYLFESGSAWPTGAARVERWIQVGASGAQTERTRISRRLPPGPRDITTSDRGAVAEHTRAGVESRCTALRDGGDGLLEVRVLRVPEGAGPQDGTRSERVVELRGTTIVVTEDRVFGDARVPRRLALAEGPYGEPRGPSVSPWTLRHWRVGSTWRTQARATLEDLILAAEDEEREAQSQRASEANFDGVDVSDQRALGVAIMRGDAMVAALAGPPRRDAAASYASMLERAVLARPQADAVWERLLRLAIDELQDGAPAVRFAQLALEQGVGEPATMRGLRRAGAALVGEGELARWLASDGIVAAPRADAMATAVRAWVERGARYEGLEDLWLASARLRLARTGPAGNAVRSLGATRSRWLRLLAAVVPARNRRFSTAGIHFSLVMPRGTELALPWLPLPTVAEGAWVAVLSMADTQRLARLGTSLDAACAGLSGDALVRLIATPLDPEGRPSARDSVALAETLERDGAVRLRVSGLTGRQAERIDRLVAVPLASVVVRTFPATRLEIAPLAGERASVRERVEGAGAACTEESGRLQCDLSAVDPEHLQVILAELARVALAGARSPTDTGLDTTATHD